MKATETVEPATVHFLPVAFQRTHTCGALTLAEKGHRIVLNGWVHRVRDHGGLVFIDLRDRYGLTQVVVRTEGAAAEERVARLARSLSPEDVLAVRGQVDARPEEMRNPTLPTGDVEVTVHDLLLLNHAATPPFVVEDPVKASEELRLRHRYLDLRRPSMQRILALRHKTAETVRAYLSAQGFLEIETPLLTKSTPEGARDFLVPSRLEHGSFYALPQSPQLYKQILMASGCDRYYQLARALRDEDARSDRVAEHTQIDLEMSFVTAPDVQRMVEGLMVAVFRDVLGREIHTPFPRLRYDEAMARYGSDKPDLRFDLPLAEVSEWAGRSGSEVLRKAAATAGSGVFALVAPGGGEWSRKVIGEVEEVAKALGAPGLFWAKVAHEGWQGGAGRFFGPEHLPAKELAERTAEIGGKEGDLVLLLAGERERSQKALGAVRVDVARRLSLAGGDQFRFAWVVDFPLFERAEGGGITPCHHMFTSPLSDDLSKLESDPLAVRADLYDLVLNGVELGSGSIRIHRRDLQERVMALIGMDSAKASERFGHLLRAFEYGAPPHGGIALGLDRVLMLLVGTDNIRDVIAFPKTAGGIGPLEDCPSPVDEEQLIELGLRLAPRRVRADLAP